MELYLSTIKKQKQTRPKITWTDAMLEQLTEHFPVNYNHVIARMLKVSPRSVIRKARELSLEKEPGFLESRREEITAMAVEAHPPHPHKGEKGWHVPNGEHSRFQPGHVPAMVTDPELRIRVHKTRNETIRRDRIRAKYNLSRLTKFKLQ